MVHAAYGHWTKGIHFLHISLANIHISQCLVTFPSLSKHIQTVRDKKITKKWPFQYISIIRIHMETCAVCAVGDVATY